MHPEGRLNSHSRNNLSRERRTSNHKNSVIQDTVSLQHFVGLLCHRRSRGQGELMRVVCCFAGCAVPRHVVL